MDTMKMEIKSLNDKHSKIISVDEKGVFSGYASVFDRIDDHNDILLPGAFKASLDDWDRKGQWPKLLWQHNLEDVIGRWLFMEEDAKGLYVEGQLLLDVQKAKEAYTLMKAGAIEGLSIGFQVEKAKRIQKTGVRMIQKVKLVEVSIVTLAANQDAKITRVKNLD